MFRAPFVYFGGKSRIAGEVWKRFGDTPNYVEPFFGSGAVLLSRPGWKRSVTWIETVNDLSGFVANFWRALQHDPEAVAHFADNPVNENDLHARHSWLVQNHLHTLPDRLNGDPDFYDAKIAGWWVWGINCWIGSGWCRGNGPWQSVDGVLVNVRKGGDAGRGVNKQLVHLGDNGTGVNKQFVHLGDNGTGVNAGAGGAGLLAWMQALADRLRRVRVTCGDWTRVTGKSVTDHLGTTAVLLDPPYSASAGRTMNLYERDSDSVANAVRGWAIAHGDNPKMRIALCGYTGEHNMPAGWERIRWSTKGGYEGQSGGGNVNQHREVVWFSPHCLKPSRVKQMGLFETD